MLTLIFAVALSMAIWLLFGRSLNNFQPGHFAPASWQAFGGALTILQIKGHSLELSVLLEDVTHTNTQGIRARIAGPLDAAGTVNADLDLDLPPYNPIISLFPGFAGVCAFGFTATRFLQVPVRVEKVHYEAAVENEVKYSFDVKMNFFSGLLVYPPL